MMKFKLLHFEINKILLFSLLGILLMCSIASADGLITNGLIAEYNFQQGEVSTTLYDISGNGHDGTISDGLWTEEGMVFDGVDDYVTIPHSSDFNTSGNMTITIAALLPSDATYPGGIIGKRGNDANQWKVHVFGDPSVMRFETAYTGSFGRTIALCDKPVICDFVVQNNGEMRCYGGGYLYDSYTGKSAAGNNTQKIYIGRAYDKGQAVSKYFNGTLYYIAIYNRSLTDSEIQQNNAYLTSVLAERNLVPIKRVAPIVALTLDDGHVEDYDNALRIAEKYNIPITSYVVVGRAEANLSTSLSWQHIKRFRDGNSGIEDHFYDHPGMAILTEQQLIDGFEATNAAYAVQGMPAPEHLAYPGGNNNELARTITANYRLSGRGIMNEGPVIKWWDYATPWYQIKGFDVSKPSATSTDINDIKALIDDTIINNRVLILYSHDVSDHADIYGCDIVLWEELCAYLAEKRDAGLIEVVTVDGIYRQMQGVATTWSTDPYVIEGKTTGKTYNSTVDYVGFVWDTTRHNNPGDVAPTSSDYNNNYVSASGNYREHEFTYTPGFSASTVYYYRACAKIDGVWVYGEELTFNQNKNKVYFGSGLSYKVTPEGFMYGYSRMVLSNDTQIPFKVIPSADSVNVTVSKWTTGYKVWNESSENHSITTSHVIGGFPANTDIQIKRDDIDYETVTSNETGYIEWVYDGGFSEHIFSIECYDFTASQTSGAYPLTTQFTASSEGIDAYYWDFENDEVIDSTKQNPVHTYGKAGTYTVNLTVQNEYGTFSNVKTDYITVSAPAFASDPVAWFNWVFSYLSSMYVSIWVTA